jgi:thiamine biosynthesis lipoprotein
MRTAVEHIMGTAVSLAAPDETDPALFAAAAGAAYAHLRRIDEIFSTYKPDSPISRIRDGRLPLTALPEHPDGDLIREILALCAQLQRESRGAFDAWNVGEPPAFDPSGAVKGWAAENASRILAAHGLTRHALNAGGDVRVRGGTGPMTADAPDDRHAGSAHGDRPDGDRPEGGGPHHDRQHHVRPHVDDPGAAPWRIGVTDPHRPDRTLFVIERAEGAVATSGTAERGLHVYDPRTHRPATALVQVTVTGPDLALADGYATAALALAGSSAAADAYAWLTDLADRTGYESLTVDPDTGVWWTPGLRRYAPALPPHPRDTPGAA